MVMLHTLRDVDDEWAACVIEDVVFREVGVHELALVKELADVEYELRIQRSIDRWIIDLGVFQPG